MSEEIQQISQRQAKILASIVKEYCETGVAVGSRELVAKYGFEISSATVRSEMSDLERLGYIHQPHTSSGRVPTDKGYRYFVNSLMDRFKLSMKEQEHLKNEVLKLQAINSEIGRRLTKLLSESSSNASFALFPEEVSTSGISKILSNPSLPTEDAREIAEFFDNIDEYAEKMMADYEDRGAEAYIGKELSLSKHSDYSMVVSGLALPSGKKGVIGIIGPKSMKYQKNLSLLEYISKILGGGSAILLINIIR